jgi:ketosteroid isomerase-like protein
MIKRLNAVLGLIVLVSACQQYDKKELTDVQRQEIADTIRKRTQEWNSTVKEFDHENLNAFLDFWVESDEGLWLNNPALWVSNLTVLPTKERMEEFWRPIVDRRSGHDIKIVEDYIAVLSEDLAIHVFKANYWVIDAEGNKGEEQTCCITNVYLRKNDVWKVLHHHQSY